MSWQLRFIKCFVQNNKKIRMFFLPSRQTQLRKTSTGTGCALCERANIVQSAGAGFHQRRRVGKQRHIKKGSLHSLSTATLNNWTQSDRLTVLTAAQICLHEEFFTPQTLASRNCWAVMRLKRNATCLLTASEVKISCKKKTMFQFVFAVQKK